MYFDRPTLKREARQAMSAARPRAMLVTLLYLLLTTGLSIPASFIAASPAALLTELTRQGLNSHHALLVMFRQVGSTGLFLHILIALFNVIILFGYQQWALNTSRMCGADISDLVCGFSMAGRILLLNLLLLGFDLVLKIIFTMAAQLAMFLFIRIPFLNMVALFGVSLFAALAPYFLMLRYSMSAYCMMDDSNLGPLQAMRRSSQLTKGHITDLILLNLSFAGWILLEVMTAVTALLCVSFPLGAAMAGPDISANIIIFCIAAAAVLCLVFLAFGLWLLPYMTVAECKFYDSLPRGQAQDVPFDL